MLTFSLSRSWVLHRPAVLLLAPAAAGAYLLERRVGLIVRRYVGRSDSNLRDRLLAHVGKYDSFAFAPARTAADAYRMECELYHEYQPRGLGVILDNLIHPDAPTSAGHCSTCFAVAVRRLVRRLGSPLPPRSLRPIS